MPGKTMTNLAFLIPQQLRERGTQCIKVRLHAAPACPGHRREKIGGRAVSQLLRQPLEGVKIDQRDAVSVRVGSEQVAV